MRNLLKKIPFSKELVNSARQEIIYRRCQKLIEALKPRKADADLIRFGPVGDGGYLIPDDLEGVTACFSPGVSRISGFELECANRGMEVYLADASVEGPAGNHPRFHFVSKFIGSETKDNFISLEDWISSASPEGEDDMILQMDIEGYEYAALSAIPVELLKRFRIIVIEFHALGYKLLDPIDTRGVEVFQKLLSTHSCVHIHPNNITEIQTLRDLEIPDLMEFTFYRNDRFSGPREYYTQFPHPLDSDNTDEPSLVLPECWRG